MLFSCWRICVQSATHRVHPTGDAQTYVWISTYEKSVGPANATTVPSGRGGALIVADTATANTVYTSYPAGDYSSPVIHTVSFVPEFWIPPVQLGC